MLSDLKLLALVSRPLGWVIAPIIFFATMKFTGTPLTLLPIIQLLLLSFPLSIIVYGINDIYDYESDKHNPRKKHIEGIKLKKKDFPKVKTGSIIAALMLITSSITTLNPWNILSMTILLLLAHFYSAPPLRLKNHPPFDSITNGLYFIGPVALAYSFHAPLTTLPIKALFATACVMGVHSLSTIMDYKVDKKVKDTTFAVKFGKRPAAAFAFLIFFATFLFAGIKSPELIVYMVSCNIFALALLIYPDEKLARTIIYLIFTGFLITTLLFLF